MLNHYFMRTTVLFLGVFFCSLNFYGQKEQAFFFDEFSVSINRRNLEDKNTGNSTGFGFGAYHAFIDTCKINLIFGLEYNRSVQSKEFMYEGHFANSTDLTYTINNLSIPVCGRVNFGKNTKLFVEAGAFLDLGVGATRKGTMHISLPDGNNPTETKEYNFTEKTDIESLN